MATHDDVQHLVDDIYEAGLEPERWSSVCQSIAAHFHARTTGLFMYRPGDERWNFGVNLGIDPCWMERFQGDFTVQDNLCEQAFRAYPVGSAVADWMLVPLERLHSTRMHQEWAVPQGLRSAALVKLTSSPECQGMLSLIRETSAGDWEPIEVKRLGAVAKHLVRATAVSRKIGVLEGQFRFAQALIDRACAPLIVTDLRGRVRYANRAAEQILARNDGISVRHGALICATTEQSCSLQALLRSAALREGPRGGWLAIDCTSGVGSIRVLVTPGAANVAGQVQLERTAIVFLSDSQALARDTEATLRARFKLTCAEARLAASLMASAHSLQEVADRLRITRNTAKTHLRRVFDKTGTHSQTELVKLLGVIS